VETETSADDPRDLLFGALAMQAGLVTADQLADACVEWSLQNTRTLAEDMLARGWLVPQDVEHVEYFVERKLARFDGDIMASFVAFPAEVREVLATISDSSDATSVGTAETIAVESSESCEFSLGEAKQRYQLNSLHAAGGIGEIWLARDADLCRDVAVKRLQAEKYPSDIAKTRFLREARITGRLEHPGVVPIYEICLDEATQQPYYSMRFLKGRTLSEAVREYHDKRKSTKTEADSLLTLLSAFTIVCNTVAYAHSKDIIHRDLKCENVILGDFGEVVVIDWGLAKEVGTHEASQLDESTTEVLSTVNPAATLAGNILGTPSYMAPEQAAGAVDSIGPATDVYGLSAILYEILCGVPPFQGRNAMEVIKKVLKESPVRPSAIVAHVPEILEGICLQGLAKEPSDRHASADQLAKSVQRWVNELAETKQTAEERERFFALSLDLLAIIDEHGSLRQTSPAWERLLGWNREQLTDAPFAQFLHCEDRHTVSNRLENGTDHGAAAAFEARAMHCDGSYRWLSWNVTPIAQERSLYVVGRDITELKQSQQLFEGVMQSAPDAMVIINAQGRIVMANNQMENVFGYSQEEMLGQPVEMLIPKQYRDHHPQKVVGFFATSAVRPMGSGKPLRGLHKNGYEFPAEISLSPILTEKGKLVAASIRDISQRLTS
jgi:eukaryotic-like serine/threonine-protein kinase